MARWFNNAPILVERNNHGHAVLLWLKDNSGLKILVGDDHKAGWVSSSRGKSLMYTACADALRDKDAILHDETTFNQLASIEGGTLRAPQGMHDDRATSYALGLVGIARLGRVVKKEARSYQG